MFLATWSNANGYWRHVKALEAGTDDHAFEAKSPSYSPCGEESPSGQSEAESPSYTPSSPYRPFSPYSPAFDDADDEGPGQENQQEQRVPAVRSPEGKSYELGMFDREPIVYTILQDDHAHSSISGSKSASYSGDDAEEKRRFGYDTVEPVPVQQNPKHPGEPKPDPHGKINRGIKRFEASMQKAKYHHADIVHLLLQRLGLGYEKVAAIVVSFLMDEIFRFGDEREGVVFHQKPTCDVRFRDTTDVSGPVHMRRYPQLTREPEMASFRSDDSWREELQKRGVAGAGRTARGMDSEELPLGFHLVAHSLAVQKKHIKRDLQTRHYEEMQRLREEHRLRIEELQRAHGASVRECKLESFEEGWIRCEELKLKKATKRARVDAYEQGRVDGYDKGASDGRHEATRDALRLFGGFYR